MRTWQFFVLVSATLATLGFFVMPDGWQGKAMYVIFMALVITCFAVPMAGVLQP